MESHALVSCHPGYYCLEDKAVFKRETENWPNRRALDTGRLLTGAALSFFAEGPEDARGQPLCNAARAR